MSMITNDWKDALSDEFKKDYYKKLYTFVKDEYSRCVVYPPADDIFNAFHFTPLKDVKVLILGQDPYHDRIYIKNYTMTVAVIILIMATLKNGLIKAYYC